MGSFTDWLIGEAGAGWVFGLVSTTALIVTAVRRAKPSIVNVKEIGVRDPVVVRDHVAERVRISFDHETVPSLGQVDLEILNGGSEPIPASNIIVQLAPATMILDIFVKEGKEFVEASAVDNNVLVEWNYLNPLKPHRQAVRISVLTTGDARVRRVTGGGQGWSVRHIPAPSIEAITRREIRNNLITAFLFPTALLYGKWVEYRFGIPIDELSSRAFITSLPVSLGFISWLYWAFIRPKLASLKTGVRRDTD